MDEVQTAPVLQPDNPENWVRYALGRAALAAKGRPEDTDFIIARLAPPPDITTILPPGQLKGVRIAILGAGLAGLAAAYELRKTGADITIYDASEARVGGRIYTYFFEHGGRFYGELGAMRIPVLHETTWHYLNVFGLDTVPFSQNSSTALIYLKNIRVKNEPSGQNVTRLIYPKYDLDSWERAIPWQQLLFYGFEQALFEATPEERSQIYEIRSSYNRQILRWDSMSTRQLLESTGLSQNAINLLSNFLPLAGQNLYSSYLDYIQEQYSADLSYLYSIRGGFYRLPQAFYNALQAQVPAEAYEGVPRNLLGSVRWRMGRWVTELGYEPGSGRVIVGTITRKRQQPAYDSFDYAICAFPFSTLRAVRIQPLFDIRKMQAIREVNYIPAQKTFFLCRDQFWARGGPGEVILGGASYTDLPLSQIYYPSIRGGSSDAGDRPGVLLAGYSFSLEATRFSSMPEPLRFSEAKREMEHVHGLPPGALDPVVSKHITYNWVDDPAARGALCFYLPGQRRLFSLASVSPEYGGRVFFAGEHTSAKHRWMQGALKSGMDAANALASAFLTQNGQERF